LRAAKCNGTWFNGFHHEGHQEEGKGLELGPLKKTAKESSYCVKTVAGGGRPGGVYKYST